MDFVKIAMNGLIDVAIVRVALPVVNVDSVVKMVLVNVVDNL